MPNAYPLSERIRHAPYLNGFYDVARQWPEHIQRRIEAACGRAAERRRSLRTPEAVRAYQREVRQRFWASMGGLPDAPRTTTYESSGQLSHLGLKIEKIVFESHPGVPVSALLYRPPRTPASTKLPAVLFLSGHHDTAKHHPEYQRVCMDLALHGLVVLAIDPWGQGERFQYVQSEGEPPLVAPGTYEHSYGGLQCFLTGGAIARDFAWDAVRAVDVLSALPYVDSTRIGVTGNSGGGTQTTLLIMADERLAAAAPATYVSGTATYFRAGLPHDAEQNYVGSLAGDIEQVDLLAAFAPKPLLVAAVAYDFFPIEATERTVEEARAVYRLLGAEEQIRLAVDDDRHWYTDPLREAAVRFFTETLDGEERYERRDIRTLPEHELWCSPTGQLHRDRPHARTIFDLNRDFLAAHRRPAPQTTEDARARLTTVLRWTVAPHAAPIRPRYFPETTGHGFTAQRFFFFSEPEVAVAGTMLRPENERPDVPTWLVLLPDGTNSDNAALQGAGVSELLDTGHRVCLFDVRGRGAVQSHPTQGRPASPLGFEAYNTYLEMLFDTSTIAWRAFDVARAAAFLLRREAPSGRLAVSAHGDVALPAYLAGALDDRFQDVRLTGMLPSWTQLVETRLYHARAITAACLIPGVLQQLDLPDLQVCFAGRTLSIEDPLRIEAPAEELPLTR